MNDLLIEELISQEKERQLSGLELIASENYVSNDVYTALGSVLTNKYAEGYPNHRYYGGCEIVDQVEQLAIDRANKLFNTTCGFASFFKVIVILIPFFKSYASFKYTLFGLVQTYNL